MVLKIRLLRFTIKLARTFTAIANYADGAKNVVHRWEVAIAKVSWKKWLKFVAKIAAFCATVTGAVTAASTTSTTTGIALGAAGATGTYVTTKGVPLKGYEKIKHVSPKTNQRANASVNMSGYKSGAVNNRGAVEKYAAFKPKATKR